MNRTLRALCLGAAAALAGSFVPTSALLVNERARSAQVDLAGNGLLAFRGDSAFAMGIRVDLRRLSDGELWRIVLDPDLRGRGMDSARRAAKWITRDLVLQQLPEGDFVPTRLFAGSDKPLPCAGDTLRIRKGTTTSWGDIRLTPEKDLLGRPVGLRLATVGRRADSLLATLPAYGISGLPVRHDSLGWAMEKGRLDLTPR